MAKELCQEGGRRLGDGQSPEAVGLEGTGPARVKTELAKMKKRKKPGEGRGWVGRKPAGDGGLNLLRMGRGRGI